MKLKKSQLKELVRHAIREVISEQEYKAKHKGGKVVTFKNKDHWKDALKTGDYEKVDAPAGKKTHQAKMKKGEPSLGTSIAGKVKKQMSKYDKLRKGTPKSAKIGAKGIEKKPSKPKITKIDKNPFSKESPAHEPWEKDDDSMKAAKSANKKMEIDDLNSKAEKGKGELIDTEHHGSVVWDQGDPDEDTFMAKIVVDF